MRIAVKHVALALMVGALIVVGGAMARSGFTKARPFTIKPGDSAIFPLASGAIYTCVNRRSQFTCLAGDALPSTTIGPALRITVHTLDGGHTSVRAQHNPSPDPTDPHMRPFETISYTFTP